MSGAHFYLGSRWTINRRDGNQSRNAVKAWGSTWAVILDNDGTNETWAGLACSRHAISISDRHIGRFSGWDDSLRLLLTGIVELHPDMTFTGVSWLYQHAPAQDTRHDARWDLIDLYRDTGWVSIDGLYLLDLSRRES